MPGCRHRPCAGRCDGYANAKVQRMWGIVFGGGVCVFWSWWEQVGGGVREGQGRTGSWWWPPSFFERPLWGYRHYLAKGISEVSLMEVGCANNLEDGLELSVFPILHAESSAQNSALPGTSSFFFFPELKIPLFLFKN